MLFRSVKYWVSNLILITYFTMLPIMALADEPALEKSHKTHYKAQAESLYTPKELKWLEQKQAITYVYDPDWAPFEWKNEIHKHTGIISDILSLIKENTGIELTPVNTETWEESVELVKNRKVDMFSAITQNSTREEYLNFTSKDIYSYPAAIITRSEERRVGKECRSRGE